MSSTRSSPRSPGRLRSTCAAIHFEPTTSSSRQFLQAGNFFETAISSRRSCCSDRTTRSSAERISFAQRSTSGSRRFSVVLRGPRWSLPVDHRQCADHTIHKSVRSQNWSKGPPSVDLGGWPAGVDFTVRSPPGESTAIRISSLHSTCLSACHPPARRRQHRISIHPPPSGPHPA